MNQTTDFVPALGRHELTGDYDKVIAVMMRERRWRAQLLRLVEPRAGQRILDIGCGTGTFAIMLKQAAPEATILGIDPDPAVLELAGRKAAAAGAEVDWRQGFGDQLAPALGGQLVDQVVSSLVLHQCPLEVKRRILAASHAVLKPGGRLLIADYGRQRTLLMRLLFRQVQMLDGFDNTEPNAKGVLPELIQNAGFTIPDERRVVPTPTGSISIYVAEKPQ
jgi:ubiquinone/menaquinone biosynthesis C-methylase UbiE